MPSTANPPTLHQHFLGCLAKCSSLPHIKQLQGHLVALGHGQNQLFSLKLLRLSAIALGDLRYARLIFDGLHDPNVFLYTAMITAYTEASDTATALCLFERMLRRGHPKSNEYIYPQVLRCCSSSSDLGAVKAVDARIQKTGFGRFSVVKTALVDGYSRCGEIGTGRRLFDELTDRNAVSWTVMVSAYMRVGMVGNAVCLFEEMPDRDTPSWNAVIAGCTQNGFFSEASSLFKRMVLSGTLPNQTTVSCMLSAFGHLGMLRLGKSVHGYICKNLTRRNTFVSNALLDMYGKCGSLREAKRLFDAVSEKKLAAWNSMINCFALHGRSDDAILSFKAMELDGPRPDGVTFVGVLNACTHAGLVDEGRSYFESMITEYGIQPEIQHYGCIIDLLGKAGKFDAAMKVIGDMKIEPDEVVWGSLLNSCRTYRNTDLGEYALRKLMEIDPASFDYGIMMANLYSDCGKWEEVGEVRKFLNETGRKKLPGCSWVEVEGKVQQFYSGDKGHPQTEEIQDMLEGLAWLHAITEFS